MDENQMKDLDLHLDLEYLQDGTAEAAKYEDGDWPSYSSGSEEELGDLREDWDQGVNHPAIQNGGAAGDADPLYNGGGLLPYEDGIDVDSEEERDIMKEIKNEITNQVRDEMKSELGVYKTKLEALEFRENIDHKDSTRAKAEEILDDVDPKLKDAILKMRKLDRILAKKMKREREVKKDRILLQKRIKDELSGLKSDGSNERKEEKLNTSKYLALTLPPSHNEGVEVPNSSNEPVFTTQLNEQDYPDVHRQNGEAGSSNRQRRGSSHRSNTASERSDCHSQQDSELGSETSSMAGSKSGKRKKRKKDFIKRNKQLASEAENPVPMTDEERARVSQLLEGLDALPDVLEEEEESVYGESVSNPFQIAVRPGEGFQPEPEDQRSLSNIDSRLKIIMPPEDYESVTSSSICSTPQYKLFKPVVDVRSERFGEKALLENKDQRELRARLQAVEEELGKLHISHELEISETPKLEEDQLQDLLDQCVRSLSRTTVNGSYSRTTFNDTDSDAGVSEAGMSEAGVSEAGLSTETTPRTPKSAREVLMENPPHLPKATLQKLLAEAYCPSASRLSTLREEDETETGAEDNEIEPISAETWKLIAQERLESEDESEYMDHINTIRSSLQSSSSVSKSRTNSRNIYNEHFSLSGEVPSPRHSRSDSRESRTPFLPEINRSGSLVAQEMNNHISNRPSSNLSNRSSVLTVRNSFTDVSSDFQDGTELLSINGDTPVPNPPSSDRRSSRSNRSRVKSPPTTSESRSQYAL
ncbi:reticulocyte binding protein 2 homolog b-like [Pecten maximus]|uniref:reticulocyte binding protein 2 homolog b-like n=1 Tax=Pecten maximus TaxID=6579 RepID=UPI001458A3A2|nr:reticulocyte binding protein 2 homolog b-like [Pecten maximus]